MIYGRGFSRFFFFVEYFDSFKTVLYIKVYNFGNWKGVEFTRLR